MHIIIYSTVYEKKHICIRIGSTGLYIYFGIIATVKLLEKKKGATHCPKNFPSKKYLIKGH